MQHSLYPVIIPNSSFFGEKPRPAVAEGALDRVLEAFRLELRYYPSPRKTWRRMVVDGKELLAHGLSPEALRDDLRVLAEAATFQHAWSAAKPKFRAGWIPWADYGVEED